MLAKSPHCLFLRLLNDLAFSYRLRFQRFSKHRFLSFVLLFFLFGKNLFFTNESSIMFSLLLNVSVSLNLAIKFSKIFCRSLMLFFRDRQNFRPKFNKLISSIVSAYVDRFIIFRFVLSKQVVFCRLEKKNDVFFFSTHICFPKG